MDIMSLFNENKIVLSKDEKNQKNNNCIVQAIIKSFDLWVKKKSISIFLFKNCISEYLGNRIGKIKRIWVETKKLCPQ